MVVYQWSTEGLSTQPKPKINHNRSRIYKVDKSVFFSENKSKKKRPQIRLRYIIEISHCWTHLGMCGTMIMI